MRTPVSMFFAALALFTPVRAALAADGGVQIGPEVELEAPVTATDSNNNDSPAIAFDGTNYLVVWTQGLNGFDEDSDIWGARVSPGGEVLDPSGFYIGTAMIDLVAYPTVAFNGTNYVVGWTYDNDAGGYSMIQLVTPAGVVLGAAPTQVTPANDDEPLSIACASGQCLAVWNNRDQVKAVRIDSTGAALDATPIVLGSGLYPYGPAQVATDGTNYQVVWDVKVSNQQDVVGARVSRAGELLNSTPLQIAVGASPHLALVNGQYLVAWTNTAFTSINAARISGAGTLLDTTAIAIGTAAYTPNARVAPLGTNYLVAWSAGTPSAPGETGTLQGVRISSAGAKLDTSPIALAPGSSDARLSPAFAADGATQTFAAWTVYRADNLSGNRTDVFGARLSSTASSLDGAGFPVALGPNDQRNLAVAGSAPALLVWEDSRLSKPNIYAKRMNADGTVIDALSFPIDRSLNAQTHPRVAFNGSEFLVVWTESISGSGVIRAARVSKAGAALDTTPIAVSPSGANYVLPAVAASGSEFLVTFANATTGYDTNLSAVRVSAAGAVLDATPLLVSVVYADDGHSEVASDGTDFLVLWPFLYLSSGDAYAERLVGARISAAGALLDAARSARW